MPEIENAKDKLHKKPAELLGKKIESLDDISRMPDSSQKIESLDDIARSKRGIETLDDIAKKETLLPERKNVLTETETRKLEAQVTRYEEFKREFYAHNLDFKDIGYQYVAEKDILPPKYNRPDWNAEIPGFWNFHGQDKDSYGIVAEKYPRLKEEIAQGRTIEELKSDPELKDAANFWYSREPVKLIKYEDIYVAEEGIHRVELAKQYKLGDIFARITEARKKSDL